MNPLEMRFLGNQLEKKGFNIHYVFYQSVRKTVAENARVIHKKIQSLGVDDLHIVGHSLGGIITMHLLDQFDDIPEGRVVMLGSPVNGSWVAKKVQHWPVISPLLSRSMPNALSGDGIPEWKNKRNWGMIAGTKSYGLGFFAGSAGDDSDGTVLLKETIHPKQIQHITVNRSHTGLLFSREVAQLTANFLNTGNFKPTPQN